VACQYSEVPPIQLSCDTRHVTLESYLDWRDNFSATDTCPVDSDVVHRIERSRVGRGYSLEGGGGARRAETQQPDPQIGEGESRQECNWLRTLTQQGLIGELQQR
jgi:hypothetical protein